MGRKQKTKVIMVTVSGVGYGPKKVELVKREVATALANIGAFKVATEGDFAGDGSSCDPRRMRALSVCAAEGLCVFVEIER